MDQVYIPKRRMGFEIGTYVVVKPLQEKVQTVTPFFYNINFLEPIKVEIINQIFKNISSNISRYDNIIITGSFLEKGFSFNDMDVLLISKEKIEKEYLEQLLENKIGIKVHIIVMSNKTLLKGISTDPLYRTMLSKCVSIKRFVYRVKPEINYKILDLHLLKSKLLVENFDFLTGREKYEMVRNAVAIALFIEGKQVNKSKVDERINTLFGKSMDKNLRDNIIIEKKEFLNKYEKFYKDLSSGILSSIKNGSK